MAGKSPAEFDADWYLATFPDVALSGLSPREHYARFGRILGRSPNGRLARASRPRGNSDAPPPTERGQRVEPTVGAATPRLEATSAPLIDRPLDLDPAAVPARVPMPSSKGAEGQPLTLETLTRGPFAANASFPAATGPLIAYARMFGLDLPQEQVDWEEMITTGSAVFQAGETRIENAWLADPDTLRLMFAGRAENGGEAPQQVFRAYQADPANADLFAVLGPPAIVTTGPVFHDLQLVHPLMPVLLEIADEDGLTQAFSLMPFPSFLPGGMHWAELKAEQMETNPMDDFWARSDLLVREIIGTPAWPERSIGRIAVETGSTGRPAAVSERMQEWLGALFGFQRGRADDASGPRTGSAESTAHAGAVTSLTAAGPSQGFELTLPRDCIPTIAALASRQLAPGAIDKVAVSYLVADEDSFRARWSVFLPLPDEPPTDVPVLSLGMSDEEERGRGASCHVAIAMRGANSRRTASAARNSTDPKEDQLKSGPLSPLSIVLHLDDIARAQALVGIIDEAAAPGSVEYLVRIDNQDPDVRDELDRLAVERGWARISADADLRDIAARAQHDSLLTLSDRVRLTDSSLIRALCALLESADAAGSASCALIGERLVKRQIVLQPASAGLFPSRVSFSASPRLSFAEPDVSEALPWLTYPVVANTLHLTAFRRDALAALPRPRAPVPTMATDVRLGLDLIEAGYRNWCTTRIAAELCGPYVRRDVIDPVGGPYTEPRRWEDLLGKVTLVRELS